MSTHLHRLLEWLGLAPAPTPAPVQAPVTYITPRMRQERTERQLRRRSPT